MAQQRSALGTTPHSRNNSRIITLGKNRDPRADPLKRKVVDAGAAAFSHCTTSVLLPFRPGCRNRLRRKQHRFRRLEPNPTRLPVRALLQSGDQGLRRSLQRSMGHLELLAVLIAISTWRHKLRGSSVHVRVDNTEALFAINKRSSRTSAQASIFAAMGMIATSLALG